MNSSNQQEKQLKKNHEQNSIKTIFADFQRENNNIVTQQYSDEKMKGQVIENNQQIETKTFITITFGDAKKRLKVCLSKSLKELRQSTNWMNDNLLFLFGGEEEIDQTYEDEFLISDVINTELGIVNMKEISKPENDVNQLLEQKIKEYEAKFQRIQNGELQRKVSVDDNDERKAKNQQQNNNRSKELITINIQNTFKKMKVDLSSTLTELRASQSWIDNSYLFQFSDGSEIDIENESDFCIYELINSQSKILKMKKIILQQPDSQSGNYQHLQKQFDGLKNQLKNKENEEKLRIANEEKQRNEKEEKERKQKEEEQRKQQEKQRQQEQERKRKEQQEEFERKKKEQEECEAYQKLLRTSIKAIKGSSKYGKEGILDILLYPRYKQEDLTDLEIQNMKVIMVIGQTGSGKSTMLDAMVNYFSGVEFDYPFRYKLIDEKANLAKRNNDQSQIATDDIQQYFIKPGPNTQFSPILVVDTPGFMDTRGIARDEKITADIEKYFKYHDQIHCVCLVSISSSVRLTCSQQYIFNRVLQIFGNDIEENIANLFTFCDGSEPKILSAIKKENIPSKYWYKFNNSALFSKKSKEGDSFERMYWEMNFESLKTFFKDVEKSFPAKSLKLTKEVLKERKRLEHTIVNIRPQIDTGLSKLEQVRKELEFLDLYSDQLEQNKNFLYLVEVEKFKKVPLVDPGLNTTTCRECIKTCDKNCLFSDDDDKRFSPIFTNGYCTVCPKKCHWKEHSNVPYIFEYYKEEEQRTSEDLKAKYISAQSNLSKTDKILVGLSKELLELKKEIYDNIQILQKSLQRLSQIALRPNPYSQTDIINQMIQNESDDKRPGFQNRISSLEAVKNQYKLLNKLTDQDRDKALQSFFQDHMSTFEDLKKKKQVKLCTIF